MSSTCVNCQTEISSNYCMNCGQRANVKRITLKEAWNDFWSRIYGFDGMFPRTIRDLTWQPGVASHEFLRGNRIRYYGPVGYFFFILTLYLLVLSLLEIDMKEYMKAMTGMMTTGKDQQEIGSSVAGWVNDNQRLISFLMMPIYMVWAWLFFRKEKMNLLEHGVLIFYTQGHVQWISIILVFAYSFLGFAPGFYWPLVINIIYYGYACSQFYTSYSKINSFVRGFFVFALFFVSISIISGIIVGIAIAMDPVLMEKLSPGNH